MDGAEDAIPSEVLIKVRFTGNTCDSCHVMNDLVDSFHHSVSLGIASGNKLPLNAAFIVDSVLHFSSKFFAVVHDDFSWPWTSG